MASWVVAARDGTLVAPATREKSMTSDTTDDSGHSGTEVVDYEMNDELMVHVALTDMDAATEGVLFSLASRATADGRRVGTLLSASPDVDPLARRLYNAGVAVHRFGRGYDVESDHMRSFGEARDLFRRLAPRLLHFHGRWSPSAWDTVLAARAAGVRTVVRTEQEAVPSLSVQRNRTKLRVVDTAVSHVVFLSRGSAQVHLTSGCEWFKNWSIIPNGVPFEAVDRQSRDRVRTSFGLPTDALVAVMTGHVEAKNGPLDFVRAAGAAARKGSALQFVLAGDGPFRAEAEQLAGIVGVEDRLRFLGPEADSKCLACVCDIRAHEGPSAILLEGVATGFPRVNLRAGGARGAPASRNATIVCEPSDVRGMAQGLLTLEAEESIQRRFVDTVEPGLLSGTSYDLARTEYEMLYRKLRPSSRSGEIPSPTPSSRMRVLA
jgi:glycosyltransferase involved in cell wall biosynthesis